MISPLPKPWPRNNEGANESENSRFKYAKDFSGFFFLLHFLSNRIGLSDIANEDAIRQEEVV
jgi:hypothetical protein